MFWNKGKELVKEKEDGIESQRWLKHELVELMLRVEKLEKVEEARKRRGECEAGRHEWEVFSDACEAEHERLKGVAQDFGVENEYLCKGHRHERYDDAYLRCKHCHIRKDDNQAGRE